MSTQVSRPSPRTPLQGYVALLAVQVFFGLFPVFGKLAMRSFPPRALAGWRITVGAAVLLSIAFCCYGRRAWPAARDLARLQACALLGIAINQVLYLEGLQRAPSVNAALVMVLIPLFVFGISVGTGIERLEARRGLGAALAAVGTILLLMRRGPHLGSEYLHGNLLMMANALCYAIYLVIAKPLTLRYPSIVLIAWVFALSTWSVPLFAADVDWAPASTPSEAWWSLAYILVFPTILAYLLNAVALGRVSSSTTAFFIFLQPMIAAVAGHYALGEQLDGTFAMASACILGGLWIVLQARPGGSGVRK